MAVKIKPTKGSKHLTTDGTHILSTLSTDRLDHLRDMLCSGLSYAFIVSVIHDEWGILTDITEAELLRLLKKYKACSISHADIAEKADRRTLDHAVNQVKQHMNTMEIYAEMVSLQRQRIHMGMSSEQEENKLSRITDEAMGTMNSLLKNYSEIAIKVGLLQRMLDNEHNTGPTYEPKNLAQAIGDDIVRGEMVRTLDGMLAKLEALPPPSEEDNE